LLKLIASHNGQIGQQQCAQMIAAYNAKGWDTDDISGFALQWH
jgi:hypothetical protein